MPKITIFFTISSITTLKDRKIPNLGVGKYVIKCTGKNWNLPHRIVIGGLGAGRIVTMATSPVLGYSISELLQMGILPNRSSEDEIPKTPFCLNKNKRNRLRLFGSFYLIFFRSLVFIMTSSHIYKPNTIIS